MTGSLCQNEMLYENTLKGKDGTNWYGCYIIIIIPWLVSLSLI